jgi:hypothetical protein
MLESQAGGKAGMIPIWNGTVNGYDWFPYWDVPLGPYQHFPLGFIIMWSVFFTSIGILCYMNYKTTKAKPEGS